MTVVSRVVSSIPAYRRHFASVYALRGFSQETKSRREYVSFSHAMTRSNKALAMVSNDEMYALLAVRKDGYNIIPDLDYTLSPQTARMSSRLDQRNCFTAMAERHAGR